MLRWATKMRKDLKGCRETKKRKLTKKRMRSSEQKLGDRFFVMHVSGPERYPILNH